jgi:hypothetical protein
MRMAEAETTLVESPVRYAAGQGYRHDVSLLVPFEAYWVRNAVDRDVVLRIPPHEAPGDAGGAIPPNLAGDAYRRNDGWRIAIGASSAGAADDMNIAGVAGGASNLYDPLDLSEPPPCPGRSLSLYFPHESWQRRPGSYTVDIRSASAPLRSVLPEFARTGEEVWGHLWWFDVSKSFSDEGAGDEVALTFSGIDGVPAETELYLIDRHLEKFIDLRAETEYRFYLGARHEEAAEASARFILLAGSAEFVEESGDEFPDLPAETALHQNFPNPFNPATVIRFDLPAAAHVKLSVYNVKGELVAVLADRFMTEGRREIGWSATDGAGEPVASGIYFYRLVTRDFDRTRKMVLLR